MPAKPTTKKERHAGRMEEKRRFDAVARRKHCIRCMNKCGLMRLRAQVSTRLGVLPSTTWLCGTCGAAIHEFISEIRRAQAEAERPGREAARARRREEMRLSLEAGRAEMDRTRAALGLPPIEASLPRSLAAGEPARKPGPSRKRVE